MTYQLLQHPGQAPAATIEMGRSVQRQFELTDAGEFEAMYRREYPRLVAVARAFSGDDGPDIVHDAMVRTLLHWGKVRRFHSPGGWCHRVVVNLCRNRWRKRRNQDRYLATYGRSDAEHRVEGPSPDAIVFWDAVRQLPQRPRAVVTLYYAGERTVTEISQTLDIPPGTVKSDLARARTALARELG